MSGLETIAVLNTKISEVEHKIPNTGNLVTTTVFIQKLVKLRTKFLIIVIIILLKNFIGYQQKNLLQD